MGTIRKGINGGFSGKVGNVSGMNWRGMSVVRSLPQKSNKPPTAKQLEQRLRFGCVTQFLTPVCPLLQQYFGEPDGVRSRRNLAISYHVREAVTGTYPDLQVDYPKVVLTMGHLPGVQQPVITSLANAAFEISWLDNSAQGQARATDTLLVVLYNEAKKEFKWVNEAARGEESFVVHTDVSWSGDVVHCWLSFCALVGSRCSVGFYGGGVLAV